MHKESIYAITNVDKDTYTNRTKRGVMQAACDEPNQIFLSHSAHESTVYQSPEPLELPVAGSTFSAYAPPILPKAK